MAQQTSFLEVYSAPSAAVIRRPVDGLPTWNHFAVLIAGCACLGCLCLPLDTLVARLFANDILPGEIRAICHRAEVFGHAYGVLAIVITIWLLDQPRRRFVPRLIAMTVIAGLSADLVKILFWRLRPYAFDLNQNISESFIGTVFTSSGIDLRSAISDSVQHSFPSAHTAMAVALAYMLGRMYPAARVWFWILTALVATNRIDGGAHFPSDVFWGGALGFLVSIVCLRSKKMGEWLARWENPASK